MREESQVWRLVSWVYIVEWAWATNVGEAWWRHSRDRYDGTMARVVPQIRSGSVRLSLFALSDTKCITQEQY